MGNVGLYYLAIDIGASGGRHVAGRLNDGKLETKEIYRFGNGMIDTSCGNCWDMDILFSQVLEGMKRCAAEGIVPVSIGVDTWGVDYVLLDDAGKRVCPVYAYRNSRTEDIDAQVEKAVPFGEIYAITGVQKNRMNTIYQLAAHLRDAPEDFERAKHLLFIPDYLHYLLSGVMGNEYTEASTSALLDAHRRGWSQELIGRLGFPNDIFGEIRAPGTRLGNLQDSVRETLGFDCDVVLPASHDTGSAYMVVPTVAEGAAKNAACLSSGTWSLIGVERNEPVISEGGLAANLGNEGGYGGRFLFLKNIMGLWMIQSVRREFGKRYSYAEIERMARDAANFISVVDVADERFLNPKSMTDEMRQACVDASEPPPEGIAETAKCIYLSLAEGYRRALADLEDATGDRIDCLNIIGGGSKDHYLNQLAADAADIPVSAGPDEGTVIGNLIAQMIAAKEFGSLSEARNVVGRSFEVHMFEPRQTADMRETMVSTARQNNHTNAEVSQCR